MPTSRLKSRAKKPAKRVLALPDLEQAKAAVLNSLTSASGQRTYDPARRVKTQSGTVATSATSWRSSKGGLAADNFASDDERKPERVKFYLTVLALLGWMTAVALPDSPSRAAGEL